MDENISLLCKKLQLLPHPEGGFFSEFYRSDEMLKESPTRFIGEHCFTTSIYYLLTGNAVSMFHKLKQDEIWHHYEGSSVILHFLFPNGKYEKHVLGKAIYTDNANYQVLVPRGVWVSAEVENKENFSLVGCTTTPGFDFSDWELAEKDKLINSYPKKSELIERLMSSEVVVNNE